jgi:LysR family transcriptional regulator, transcriptional activator of the cysJI operon
MLARAILTKGDPLSSLRNGSLPTSFHGFGRVRPDATRHLGMTLNQFALFVAVAKYASLTKASAELRVSQPSVSQQLRQLELHYGAKLYRRLSKGIEITEAGRLFLRQVTPILQLVAKLGNSGKPAPAENLARQVLTIGGTFSASAVLLPTLLARLQQRHPRAELELRTGRSAHLERSVLSGAMDLAVTAGPAHSDELVSEPLRREKVVLFVPAKHRFAKLGKLKLSDLVEEPFIIRGGKNISGVAERVVRQLRDRGLNINVGLRCEEPAMVKAAVRQGMGVGVAFEETVKAPVRRREFEILNIPGLKLAGQSFVIYARKTPLSPLAQEFLELLRGTRVAKDKITATRGSRALRSRRRNNILVAASPIA